MDSDAPERHRLQMAEIVNLRIVRKSKARAEALNRAAENRTRFGRTKAEKAADAADRDRAVRLLDQAKRDPDRSA